MSGMDLQTILNRAVKEKASDVHLRVGLPPILRVHGNLVPLQGTDRLTPDDTAKLVSLLLNERQQSTFKVSHQIDTAYSIHGLGRFRVNIFQQRGTTGVVLRVIPMTIHPFDELHLPKVLERIAMEQRGLILVTGVTGSGKTTTIASMIDYINIHRTCHITTIEDPIEFLHKDKRSIIDQREVGSDTPSFAEALRAALRQDPDVILVGEMRDLETIEIALLAAETGHLVFSTLHTMDATESINRIVSVFPPHQHQQVRVQLSGIVKGIISQRLVPTRDGKGRVPAVEVMISTARIRECILDKDKTKEIPDAISKGYTTYGMQTFDQSLLYLLNKGLISYEEALKQATNPGDFALRVKGITATSDMRWGEFEGPQEEKKKGGKVDTERF